MVKKHLVTCCLAFLCFTVHAQQTKIYEEPQVLYNSAIDLFQQEKYGAAEEKFKEVIGQLGTHADNNQLLLINSRYYEALCSKQQAHPDAEKLFIDLVDDYGENPVTRLSYFHLGDIYFDQKKYDKALSWYKKVDVYDLSEEEKSEYEFQAGFCYFYKKQFDKAESLFDDVKKQGKYFYPANYYSGYISYKQGAYADALQSFKEIEKSTVYQPIVPYYIASIYYQQKKYDDVIAYASAYNANDKIQYKAEMQQLVGKAYFEKGQFQKATPYFTAYRSGVTKMSKSDLYQVGYCQYVTKSYLDAIGSFKELNVLKDSLGQNALYLLGDCYLKTDQKDNARLAFEQASKMDFDPFIKENAAFQFAKLSYDLNYHDVAVTALQDFIAGYPKSPYSEEAKEYLTLEFLGTQNYKDALGVLRDINSKSPRIRMAYQKVAYSRATELYNAKDYEGAISIFDESLKNPSDPVLQAACYFWKGEASYNLGNYDEAIKNHLQFLEVVKPKQTLPANVSETNAKYTLGYGYLKQKSYDKSSGYFEEVMKSSSAQTGENEKKLYADAALRSGDCDFVLKNYASAVTAYEKVSSRNMTGSDYALYQEAIIQGLQNHAASKISLLKKIGDEYPGSIYMDDALYELGIAYLSIPSYQEASAVFNRIITSYPNSSYVSKAHLKMGLIYFNLDDNNKALEEYKWVLSKYPKTPEGREAQNGVKEIYTDKGDAQGYLDFVKNTPTINVTDAVKDSVMYLAAETRYSKSDCAGSIKEFSAYLSAFPDGAFALPAHFYRAECLFRQSDFDPALKDYEFVADQPQSRFSEKALLNAARISYVQKKDYGKAYRYYKALGENAEFKANNLEALKGMMYTAFYLNQFENTTSAARKILAAANAGSDDVAEAHYYLAKIALSQNELTPAFDEFSIVAKQKSAFGAESAYEMADIYFRQSNLKAAEEQCYTVIKQKSGYNYWIAKSYLLLADIFDAQEDYFQARSTLQSIIDNYKGADEIVAVAKDKLEKVSVKELNRSKLKQDNNDEMELDSIPPSH